MRGLERKELGEVSGYEALRELDAGSSVNKSR